MMGLAYLTPMTVFDTFGIVSGISDGHVPASYCLARWRVCCLPLSATANWFASFRRPVRSIPTRKKSINPHVGFMVGWSSLLDYLFLPID